MEVEFTFRPPEHSAGVPQERDDLDEQQDQDAITTNENASNEGSFYFQEEYPTQSSSIHFLGGKVVRWCWCGVGDAEKRRRLEVDACRFQGRKIKGVGNRAHRSHHLPGPSPYSQGDVPPDLIFTQISRLYDPNWLAGVRQRRLEDDRTIEDLKLVVLMEMEGELRAIAADRNLGPYEANLLVYAIQYQERIMGNRRAIEQAVGTYIEQQRQQRLEAQGPGLLGSLIEVVREVRDMLREFLLEFGFFRRRPGLVQFIVDYAPLFMAIHLGVLTGRLIAIFFLSGN